MLKRNLARGLCFLVLLGTSPISAGIVGGMDMLKNDHSARPAGMGAAYVSMSGDANAIAYNPASATGLDMFTASFGHTVHWENIRFESGHFGIPLLSRLWLHGGIRYAADDKLEKRIGPTAEPEALFDAHDLSCKAGLAYELSSRLSLGIAAGWLFEEIEGWHGSAFNMDFGLLVHPGRNITLGASATNMGPGELAVLLLLLPPGAGGRGMGLEEPDSRFKLRKPGEPDSREISFPTTYRFGASYDSRYVLVAADMVYLDCATHLHLGAETGLQERFQLRAGYMTGYDTKSFTAGASFGMRNITVDYAFVPFTSKLGTSHLFNLTFSL